MSFSTSIPTAFSQTYRNKLLSTLDMIDTDRVAPAIEWMKETRHANRALFVAGNGGSATAAHFVCDVVKGAIMSKANRFRIVGLGQNLPTMTAYSNDLSYTDALLEEFKNFAQPGHLYMAISGSG